MRNPPSLRFGAARGHGLFNRKERKEHKEGKAEIGKTGTEQQTEDEDEGGISTAKYAKYAKEEQLWEELFWIGAMNESPSGGVGLAMRFLVQA